MSEREPERPAERDVAQAVVETRSRPSFIWVIPVVAALTGAFVAWRAISERGPAITIRFATAEGLEAGKTKIKYKDVEVGLVEAIELADDLSGVEVHARMRREFTHHLTRKTRFWVVKARVAGGQVSGLGTLFSGAYIAVDPATEGASAWEFVGLEQPPPFTSDEPGTVFHLRAESLGSLDVGSPVYYRWIEVGEVVSHVLDESGKDVAVDVFVRAPNDQRVRANTVFWNASGIDVHLTAAGLEVDTPSLASLLIGGVSFETPGDPASEPPVAEGFVFPLFPNKAATTKPALTLRRPFLLHFGQSVAGLVPGSPVEFRGIQIGEVREVHLEFDDRTATPRVPVLIEIQPQRIQAVAGNEGELRRRWNRMVEAGLRAQLTAHNLLTGQLAVSFDFHPGAAPKQIDWTQPVPELPTVPSPIEQLTTGLTRFVGRLQALPLEDIGDRVSSSLQQLEAVLVDLQQATPALVATLAEAERTLTSANALIAPDSQTSQDLRRALRELAEAARSLRLLAEQLEQEPESLIRGKEAGR